jgi:predicted DNA-binding protein
MGEFNKEILVRIPPQLHEKLKVKAFIDKTTVSEIIRGALEQYLGDFKAETVRNQLQKDLYGGPNERDGGQETK